MKRILLLAALFAALGAEAQLPAEIRLDKRSLRPRYREWAQPAGGVAVTQNPPALLWPASGRLEARALPRAAVAGQHLRRSYALGTVRMGGLCLPRAAGRRTLVLRQWSVSGRVPRNAGRRSTPSRSMLCRRFATPTGAELARRVAAMPHHRLYVPRDGADARTRSQRNPEARELVRARQEPEYGPRARRPDASARHDGDDALSEKVARQLHVPQVRRGGHAARRGLLDGLPDHGRGAVPRRCGASRPACRVAAVDSDATCRRISTARPSLVRARGGLRHGLDRMERAAVLEAIRVRGANTSTATTSRISRPTDGRLAVLAAPSATSSRPSPRWATSPRPKKWFRYCYEVWCARFPDPRAATTAAGTTAAATCRPIS